MSGLQLESTTKKKNSLWILLFKLENVNHVWNEFCSQSKRLTLKKSAITFLIVFANESSFFITRFSLQKLVYWKTKYNRFLTYWAYGLPYTSYDCKYCIVVKNRCNTYNLWCKMCTAMPVAQELNIINWDCTNRPRN